MGPERLRGGPADGSGLGLLQDVATAVGGRVLAGAPDLQLGAVAADTRAVRPGDLFCALRGERVDAHQLLGEAFAAGAAAVLVDRPAGDVWSLPAVPAGRGVVWVPAAVPALASLAHHHLRRVRSQVPLRVTAVTGSVGKTGTRTLIAAALGADGQPVLSPERSFNTEITVPLVCLRADAQHRQAVLELAMRGPGQIAQLAAICQPDVGVLTVIGESHLELLGSVEAIARAKGELLQALGPDGLAVLNADDPWQRRLATGCPAPVCWYGEDAAADVRAEEAEVDEDGRWRFRAVVAGRGWWVRLRLLGRHQIHAALAALACAHHAGVDLQAAIAALARVGPHPGRLDRRRAGRLWVLDDAFNAAPLSVLAALKTLTTLAPAAGRAAVLGDMRELGAASKPGHRQVGEAAAAAGLAFLLAVGPLAGDIANGALRAGMPADRVHRADDAVGALDALGPLLARLPDGATILVKGAHAVGLDRVVTELAAPDAP